MTRPMIPRPLARQLRQEAGFGCCRCGLPIYQYHHIVPYHEDDPYPPEEMMILCPTCHDLATKGGLPVEEQKGLKAEPHNIRAGLVEGSVVVNQTDCAMAIGELFFVGEGAYIAVDNERLLALGVAHPDRSMTLSLNLYDEDDALLAVIEDNEWIAGDPLPWDIQSDHQELSIRRLAGDINLEVDARQEPISVRARLWRKGRCIELRSGIRSGTGAAQSGIDCLGLAGMAVAFSSMNDSWQVIPDPRFGAGVFVSERDTRVRLRKTIGAWNELRRTHERDVGRNDPCWCRSGFKFKRCHGAD